jgi:outer membrane protein assembly factor BamC
VIRLRLRYAMAICATLLVGCGWMSDDKGFFVDRSNDYLKAQEGPPLVIPEDLSSTAIQNTMAIPQVSSSQRHVNFEGGAPRPEAIYAREEADGVKIQKLGDQRWLLVPQAPAVVWPKVKQFFADNGVAIELEQPQTGRIDTEWMMVSSNAARDVVRLSISDAKQSAGISTGRDRVRVLIEPGIRDRSTEIHLRYENDSKSMPHEDVMPAQSDIVEVETQLLNELGGYIAANVADASISFVARNISTQSKAELQRDASDLPTLRLNLDFDRAWATVNQALHEAKLDVTDVDRSAGVFYVTVTDQMLNQEEKPSIWTRWFRSEHKRKVTILMEPKTPGFDLTVFDDNGQRTASDVAEQILIMIREFAT